MSDAKIMQMASATSKPVVALIKYNKLKSRIKDGFVFVLEGDDDPIFYTIAAQRSGFKDNFSPLVVNGKDMVLGLRQLLSESLEAEKTGGVAFFVDADFDGLKNYPSGKDIYITPTYSTENIICTSDALKSLLNLEFKLHKDDLHEDIEPIVKQYLTLLDKFHTATKHINLTIYFGRNFSERVANSHIISIEKRSDKFFKLDKNLMTIICQCPDEKIKQVIKFDKDINLLEINVALLDFEKLIPATQWRGKFLFSFFVQAIQLFVEDRNSGNPKFFSKGNGKVKLSLATDSAFRILSSACEIPICLSDFFTDLPINAMR